MIVWGGRYCPTSVCSYFNTGGRYNPDTDGWVATSTTNAPTARATHSAVWTGSEMIAWGGFFQDSGAAFISLTLAGDTARNLAQHPHRDAQRQLQQPQRLQQLHLLRHRDLHRRRDRR